MRIENCVIITSKDSRIEMTADELRHFFAGNCVVDRDHIADALPTPTAVQPSGDQDATAAKSGRAP